MDTVCTSAVGERRRDLVENLSRTRQIHNELPSKMHQTDGTTYYLKRSLSCCPFFYLTKYKPKFVVDEKAGELYSHSYMSQMRVSSLNIFPGK